MNTLMVNFSAFITTYSSFLSVFITNSMCSGNKKHHEVLNQKFTKQLNIFLCFFPLLLQTASSKLRDSFTVVFTQNNIILHWAVHKPNAFSQHWSLTKHFSLVTEELYRFIFFICAHVHESLSKKKNIIIAQDCWIRIWLVCMETRRVCHSLLRTDLLLIDRCQASAQACTCC